MTYRPRTVLDEIGARDFKPSGVPGATAASRYVGATVSGAPTSGTFAVGDFVVDQTGTAWVCTVAGSPGTWTQLASGSSAGPATATTSGLVVVDRNPATQGPYPTAVLADNPLAYWRLGDAAGSIVVADSSGNGRIGTVNGAVTLGGTGLLGTDSTTCAQFNGGNISISSTSWLPTTTAYTLEAVITTTGNNNGGIVGYGNAGQTNRTNVLRLAGSSGLDNYWWSNDISTGTTNLAVGAHHVAATWDGTTRTLYCDGVAVASAAASGFNAAQTNLMIGNDNNGEVYSGYIQEVAIYASALSATRIAAHNSARTAAFSTPTPVVLTGYGLQREAAANAAQGRLSVGGGTWDGVSPGHFAGVSAGTELALNTASGYTGSLIDAQVGGVSKVKGDALGNLTVAGEAQATDVKASGLSGATSASRYVGATASGAPTSGTFAVGDFVIDQTGTIWVCTGAGTPGAWTQIAGGGGMTNPMLAGGDLIYGAAGSPTYAQSVLADVPLVYFRLGETSGTTEHDSSGHVSDATYTSTISSTAGPIADGNAAQVFSNAQQVNLANTITLSGDFTLEWWMKEAGALDNTSMIFGLFSVAGGLPNVNCAGNQPRLWTGASDIVILSAATGSWQHYVITRSGTSVVGYVNGVAVSSGSWAGTFTFSNVAKASCSLDEIAVYTTALSAARVAAHYSAAAVASSAAGTPTRLPIGSAGQFLQPASGLPAWGQPTTFAPSGLPGAAAASRYVGATTSGAPSSGTFAVGDYVVDRAGKVWICTAAGTPGTWGQAGNMHYRSAWSSGTTYAPNDVVTYGGATYIAVTAGSNNTPGPVGNAFTGTGSNSSVPFAIATGTGIAQTIGGFWLKLSALPVARTALLELSDPSTPATKYYRLVCGVDGHVYLEAQVLGQAAISLDISVNALVPGTWYWVGFGSDCPGGAINYMGGVETLGGGSNSFTQSLTQSPGAATFFANWVLSVGTSPSSPSLATLPSAWYMADIRISTGDSSFGPFVRTDPVDTPSQGSPVASYAAPAGTGPVSQLLDGVSTRNITGSFSIVADNPVPSTQWTVLPSSLPGTATFAGEVVASDFKAAGLPGATAASRYVGGTASGAPTSGTFAVGDFVIDQTAKIWLCTVAGSPGTWVQLSGGGSSTLAGDTDVAIASPIGGQVLGYNGALSKWVNQNVAGVAATQSSSILSADVSMSTANSYYDGPSVSLPPGTWLLTATCSVETFGVLNVTAKIWDGTIDYAASTEAGGGAGYGVSVSLSTCVTPTTTTTYKLSAAINQSSATMKAQTAWAGVGSTNDATYLRAVQLSGNPVGQQAPAVRCYNSAAISIQNNVETALTFDTNRLDQGTSTAQHSTSSNTGRLTCQQAGVYHITALAAFAQNATGDKRYIYIRLNGTTNIGTSAVNATPASDISEYLIAASTYYLSVGDYIEVVAFQNSGGALNITNQGNTSPEFMMARVDSGPGVVQPNTKIQLDYQTSTASDVSNGTTISANTWTDVIGNQTFTVDDPNSVVEITVGGAMLMGTNGGDVGSRLVVDSGGTPIIKQLGGGNGQAGTVPDLLAGSSPIPLTGLTAGNHTAKVQVWSELSNALYLRTNTKPNAEFVTIRVLERKQSSSPPSSTPAPAVRCYNSAAISVNNATLTILTFDTNRIDQGTSTPQHSTTSNTSRLTCQQSGFYVISASVKFDNNGTGIRESIILLNGATSLNNRVNIANSSVPGDVSNQTAYYLNVGDYIELQVYQNSGGALNVQSNGNETPEFSMARVDSGGQGFVPIPMVKTSSYTITNQDCCIVAGANNLTFTLPAASGRAPGMPLLIKNDNFTGTSLARSGSDTIDGATSFSLPDAYSAIQLVGDGISAWRVF